MRRRFILPAPGGRKPNVSIWLTPSPNLCVSRRAKPADAAYGRLAGHGDFSKTLPPGLKLFCNCVRLFGLRFSNRVTLPRRGHDVAC